MKKNNLIFPSILLAIISGILALGIFLVNDITKGIIADSESTKLNSYYENIFPDSEFQVIYDNTKDSDKDSMIISVAEAKKNGQVIGYLYLVASNGYSGEVVSLIGIDKETSKVIRVIVTKQTETPGLGTKATEPGFLDQFTGKESSTVLKAKDNINAITGATITSSAVVKAVNTAFEDFNENYRR